MYKRPTHIIWYAREPNITCQQQSPLLDSGMAVRHEPTSPSLCSNILDIVKRNKMARVNLCIIVLWQINEYTIEPRPTVPKHISEIVCALCCVCVYQNSSKSNILYRSNINGDKHHRIDGNSETNIRILLINNVSTWWLYDDSYIALLLSVNSGIFVIVLVLTSSRCIR